MNDAAKPPIMAIDGGGTRCRVVYAAGETVVSRETGSANVSSNFDAAISEVLRGIAAVSDAAGLSERDVMAAPAFVGLAGVTGPAIAGAVRRALPFAEARIEDDRVAALRGALGAADGVVAHCGTGSFFAGQVAGKISLSGGWGSVLGDEASACWVGRLALQLTLETVDARLAASPLSDALLAEFDDSAGIVRFASTASPSDFGALAPRVTKYASDGDAIASNIMQLGAAEIARALRCLGWQPGQVVCLTGGIGPEFRAYLPDDIRSQIVAPSGTPLDGAIALAHAFAKEVLE